MSGQSNPRVPRSWEEYERGQSPRQDSVTSETSRVHFDERSSSAATDRLDVPGAHHDNSSGETLRRRRSSLSMRVSSFAQLGGVNSLENFARSWQRAVGFNEIPGGRPSFEGEDDGLVHQKVPDNHSAPPHRSLLRQQLENEGRSSETVVDGPSIHPSREDEEALLPHRYSDHAWDEVRSGSPLLGSPFPTSYGGLYGSLSSRIVSETQSRPGYVIKARQESERPEPDKEHPPLIVKVVETEDGKQVHIVVGQSTLPQTVFNSVNVLIGVGILSLPLGLRYSGWLVGIIFLFFAALTTHYTARILARCLAVDSSLVTFADLAFVSFGPKARIATSVLFTVELVATCVALVILFGDSLYDLVPVLGRLEWKIICGAILIPLSFVPLRYLSFTSILGIMSTFGIVILVIIDGLTKTHSPGSLRHPAKTHLFPDQWSTLPLSFGLLMSPWGGHSVFPNIYRDMRHPHKYTRALNCTYAFTYSLDMCMAIIGLLMFGDHVRDEVTSNILLTKGYSNGISVCIVVFIAIIPLTKIPLNARPIFVTIEILCGLHNRSPSHPSSPSSYTRKLLKGSIRTSLIIFITVLAIFIPNFETIMGLMGSATCFSICAVLPLAFYLKMFGKTISAKERMLDWFLIVLCSIMGVMGTVWVCLPRDMTGAR